MKMSDQSTGYHLVRRTGQQGTRPSVLIQVGVEKYATGCVKLPLPSKHLNRLNKSQINQNKNKINCNLKTIIRTNKLFISTINLRTAKEEIKLAEYKLHVKNNKNDICFIQETHKTG